MNPENQNIEQQEVILRPSKARSILAIAGSLIFVAGGYWMVQQDEVLGGWLCISVFGIAALAACGQLLSNRSYLKVNAEGFSIHSLFNEKSFRWEEVRTFRTGRLMLNKMVVFDFSPLYQRQEKGRKFSKDLMGSEAMLPSNYGLKVEYLAELMNDWKRISEDHEK